MTRNVNTTVDRPRALIVGPAWIGDMVMAQSLFKLLRRERPGVQIDVLAPAWCAPLLKRMPQVRKAITLTLTHGQLGLRERYYLGRELAGRNYQQAIILPRAFKAALIPWFASVPRRTGYRGEMRFGAINDMRRLDKAAMPQMARRYAALGLEPGATLPPMKLLRPELTADADNAARLMAEFRLSRDGPAVGLMPGAEYGPAKQWPLEYYASLARQLMAEGAQVWIFGSQKDYAAGEQIVEQSGCGINLCGKTRLEDAIDLIAQVQVAVSNDSGLMHVAAAVDVPLVAIFGSSTPDYTPPLSERATVIYEEIACSPCFDRTCRYGHYRCLRDISVMKVLQGIHARMPTRSNSWKAGISF
jgi:heptosyltransferase II